MKKEDKPPRALLQCLSDLLDKWLKPLEMSKVEFCYQILLEHFLLDLHENTQCWVSCHHPKCSAEALQLAKDFENTQGDNNRE